MTHIVPILIALIFLTEPTGRPVQANTNAKIKAIFLYNFTQYIDWPVAYKKDNFTIGLLGSSNLHAELEKLAKLKKVGSQKMVIKRYATVDAIQKCHILYMPADQSAKIDQTVKKLGAWSTLLVTDKPGLAQRGAGINFVVEQNKQKFELNKVTLKKHNLVVSSSLLKLAKTVY